MLKDPINENDHIRGNKNSRIVLLEYGDFECPYCALAHDSTQKLLEYLKGDLCYVFRNFPLTQLHPHAQLSAETAEFAGDYDKYWKMHDLLFYNQKFLGLDLMFQLVESLNLPLTDYKNALENRTYLSKVKSDVVSGTHNKIHGTPSFFLNNQRYQGPYDVDSLVEAIEKKIKMKKASGF